jgi:hypothetical protein
MDFRSLTTTIAIAAMLGLAACSGAADKAQGGDDTTVIGSVEEPTKVGEAVVDATDEENGEAAADAAGEAVEAAADAVAGDGTDEAADEAPNGYVAGQSTDIPPVQSVWCSDVRKRVPATLCQDYRDQIADLDQGIAAFDPPRDMVKGKTSEVRLAIGPEEEKLRVESLAGDEGKAVTAGIEIGAKMRARLTGRAFDIDPDVPVDLEMGRSRRQVWTWDVTPKREGTHPLSAEITVLATDGTILNRYPSDLIRVNVTVSESEAREIARAERAQKRAEAEKEVGFWTRMAKLLLEFWWAAVALLGGMIGGYFYLRNKLRSEEATPPPS